MVIATQRDIECSTANPEDHCPLVIIRLFEFKGIWLLQREKENTI